MSFSARTRYQRSTAYREDQRLGVVVLHYDRIHRVWTRMTPAAANTHPLTEQRAAEILGLANTERSPCAAK
jgi:hypothetical protein